MPHSWGMRYALLAMVLVGCGAAPLPNELTVSWIMRNDNAVDARVDLRSADGTSRPFTVAAKSTQALAVDCWAGETICTYSAIGAEPMRMGLCRACDGDVSARLPTKGGQ